MISGTIPSFLGARPIRDVKELAGLDAVIAGLPWEGTNTWGSYSGCEQAPKACRLASLRYGTGYLPEYDVEVMTALKVGDFGDLPTHPSDVEKTFASFEQGAAALFSAGPVPIFMGGDHSASYPVLKALTEQRPKRVGVIHFDAHMDNADEYAGDRLARCCPLRRIAELPGIDPTKIVHIGIRGPRNSPSQVRYAREHGMPLFTMGDIRKLGLPTVLSRAREITEQGTDGYYVTVCSDIMDHAFNPGGALDFGGLSSADMCEALFGLAQGKMLGFDIVEVYPRSDVGEAGIHLMTWLVIYVLAGVVVRLQSSH